MNVAPRFLVISAAVVALQCGSPDDPGPSEDGAATTHDATSASGETSGGETSSPSVTTATPTTAAATSSGPDSGTTSAGEQTTAGPELPDPDVCTRDPTYDELCASMGQPPAAYQCFAPGGVGIPSACVVNGGTLIVCCPA